MELTIPLEHKILVAKTVKARESQFVEMSLNDIMDTAVLGAGSTTLYEVIHPEKNKWIKPYFDIDDKGCTVSTQLLYNNIIDFLNSIFETRNEDWAITDDSRKSKSSFHVVLPNHKTTIADMIRLKEFYKNEFKQLCIDCTVYANGYQKMRMVHFKHETDPHSTGLNPLSFEQHNQTHKHIISIVEDNATTFSFASDSDNNCKNQTTVDKCSKNKQTVDKKPTNNHTMKMSDDLNSELQKYNLLTDLKDRNGFLVAYIEYPCPWNNHKNNNRFITVNPVEQKIILKCHSSRCKNQSKIIYEVDSCHINYDIDNDSQDSKSIVFDINKFNNIRDKDIEQKIRTLYEKITASENEIETLKDNIVSIDPKLKTSIISQQKQQINKNIRQIAKQIKILKKKLVVLHKTSSTLETEKKSKYFEIFHAKIMKPFCFIRLAYNDFYLYNQTQLSNVYANLLLSNGSSFIDKWLVRSNIKTYENIDFLPPPVQVPDYIYNSFDCFEVESLDNNLEYDESLIKPILKHLELLTNNCKKSYEYVLNYLAHLIQKPGEISGVALVFRSEKEGVGKNLMFEEFI